MPSLPPPGVPPPHPQVFFDVVHAHLHDSLIPELLLRGARCFPLSFAGGLFLLQPFDLAFEVVDLVAQTFILLSGLGQLFVLIFHRYMGFVYGYKVTKNLRHAQ